MTNKKERVKILIVDDEEVNIDVLVSLLKPEYKTVIAMDGDSAFKRLEKHPLPDLILLDVTMPGMDGYEVCRRLKSNKETSDIPVIFLTGKSETQDILKGFRVGAVDYVTKPFRPGELTARINTHIKLKKTISALESALNEITTLKGMLPICSNCKKIRDDKGYWSRIEVYISNHTEAEFTHGICPDCIRQLYPEIADSMNTKREE